MKLLARMLICSAFCLVLRAQTPEWIWHDNKGKAPADDEVTYFRKTFSIQGKVQRADVAAAGDDQARVYINGKQVLQSPSWNKATRANVAKNLQEGENLLAAMGKNDSGD